MDLGAEVVICAREAHDLELAKTCMSSPGMCHTVTADLSTCDGVAELVRQCPFEGLHILVNNVGMNIRRKPQDYTPEEFARIFDSNFFSAYRLSVAFLPRLRKAVGGSAVVNVGSVAGSSHIPSGCAYAASKAAMEQMTRNLAVEWSGFGIRVNTVAPGPIQTPLLLGANPTYLSEFRRRIPLRRFGKPTEVAQPIAFLASDAASYITGQCITVDGGFLATSFNAPTAFWEDDQDTPPAPVEA